MKDPYKILGVSRTDSDEHIKSVYRDLAKKYHPDNYVNNPLSDLASEKMSEINEAYDEIMNERRAMASSNRQSSSYNQNYGEFRDVRTLIMNGRIEDAEQILDGVPEIGRDAEWNFLKGTIYYKKGWMQDAFKYFSTACRMDPTNPEYAAAYNELNRQRNGDFGMFGRNNTSQSSCTACDICTGIMCMDCLCDCFRCC